MARWVSSLLLGLSLASPAACGEAKPGGAAAPLRLEQTIPLQGVSGRIDHLAVDVQHRQLFVAELGNGSVGVVDLAGGPTRRITGLKEPQGLAYLPDRNELVVASGGDGSVRFYDAATLSQTGLITLGDEADNVRVEPRSGEVVVGYGSGVLAFIDPARRIVIRTIKLPGHPEGFRLDAQHGRAFVNIPDVRRIAVANLASGTVARTWPEAHRLTFPMALDEASSTLAVISRLPAHLVLLDTATGATRQDLSTCGDADDVFFDAKRHRIYVSCGSGAIDVLLRSDTGYGPAARVATRSGARTSLFVPELDRLFVAARAGTFGQDAAILVFQPR